MAIEPHDPVSESSKEKGYEVADAAVPPAVIGLVVLLVLMVGGFIGGRIFQRVFEATEVRSRPEPPPLARREPVSGPLLQPHPVVELDAYLDSERGQLGSYGWVDASAGIVRIPIERAMKIVASEGLPRWAPVDARVEAGEGSRELPWRPTLGGGSSKGSAPPEEARGTSADVDGGPTPGYGSK